MSTGRVAIAGTFNKPVLKLYFHPSEPHAASPHRTLTEMVEEYILGKARGSGYWSKRDGCWMIFATGPNPARIFEKAGMTVDFSEIEDRSLQHVVTLDQLADPLTRLSATGANALILPRLLGFDNTKELLGSGASWDKTYKRFTLPVASTYHRGFPLPGINWQPEILEAGRLALGKVVTPEEIASATAAAGAAKDILEMDEEDVAKLIAVVGDIPDWFGLDLFPFQRIGAIAVAAGHSGLFDEPGLGKTRQSIAAAAIRGSTRTLITCLPVGLTGWRREVLESGLNTLGGQYPDGEVVVIRSGKKEPETLPEHGVIITSDSLLTSRADLRRRIIQWQPEVFVYDEAHRGKTFASARSAAMLEIANSQVKLPIAVTGTPLFANPAELAPLLQFTGHLSSVFGGLTAFYERYCRQDKFGNWQPRKEHLVELRMKLMQHVWVRRKKREVLPDLPATIRVPKYVDVPLADYRRAYKDVITVLQRWVSEYTKATGSSPDEQAIKEFASTQIGLISQLRKAAGVAKIPAIVDDIRAHVNDTMEIRDGRPFFPRPLIVWTHHTDVSDALVAAVPKEIEGAGIIRGDVSADMRDHYVREFQANRIPVLLCSIAAAGVAITLTASSDMFFAESDWTPAAIRQAMDRAERIGQTADKIIATTYLAEGTLDFRIQQVLKEKSKILDKIYDSDNDVSVFNDDDEVETATMLVVGLINDIINPGGDST